MEAARSLDLPRADALVISACVQMPSLPLVETAEREFGLPVLSAATAGAYSVLRALGLPLTIPGAGSLLLRRDALTATPALTSSTERRGDPMTELENSHLVRGVDHAAFPTFDPAGTVRFYRDVLGFPVVHSICAAGWGPGRPPGLHPLLLRHRQRRPDRVLLLLRPAGAGPVGRARVTSTRGSATTYPVLRELPAPGDPRRQPRSTCWSTVAGSTPQRVAGRDADPARDDRVDLHPRPERLHGRGHPALRPSRRRRTSTPTSPSTPSSTSRSGPGTPWTTC